MKGKRPLRRAARLIGGAGVGLVGVVVDVPSMCAIALAKAPVLLLQGWREQLSMMGNCMEKGNCSWQACLPLTAALLLFWPVRVAASIPSALLLSFWKAGYSGWIAYSQGSVRRGLKHAVAAVAEFDESTNDEARLWCHGSCLPRPSYSASGMNSDSDDELQQQVEFHRILPNGVELVRLLRFMASDEGRSVMEQSEVMSGDLKKDSVAILYLFLTKSVLLTPGTSVDLMVYDPLETLERQIKKAELQGHEWHILRSLVLSPGQQQEQEQFLAEDRKGLLEAFGRRIRGVAGFVSRDPAFKVSYQETLEGLAP